MDVRYFNNRSLIGLLSSAGDGRRLHTAVSTLRYLSQILFCILKPGEYITEEDSHVFKEPIWRCIVLHHTDVLKIKMFF